ncbi:endonuclease/exonuclease/phosphatase family protein [Rhizobium leucaenae]|uniref:Endonuclease/exonuclease/phosphatase family metal-dependent hydrolase n=1 Tax=Rhizobium leucaenae TaxID=29450 RepID=A0A7W7EMR4_9HYPH|nr:endonuclease/exonuclease/phosphatase family protein [Rhizobium leucaenae]MBB4570794.1 endonuclease/exonuclease/phosphatase family metal-dependent hydrolase [Rhizobium leucaenae]
MRVRVVTLNVWNVEGDSRRHNIINQELRRLKPDLVALQEVIQSAEARTLDTMMDGLGLHVTHQQDVQVVAPPYADRYGGAAIATRWPHKVVEVLDPRMPQAPDVPWATLAATVDLGDIGSILFIGTTAAWRPAAEAARERHAVAITDLDSRHRQDLPTIIAGDLNANPDAASIRYLTGRQSLDGRSVCYYDAWEIGGHGKGDTWTVANPNAAAGAERIIGQANYHRRFDYVLVGSWDAHPNGRAEIQSAERVFDQPAGGVWPSDHYGVMVDIELQRT